jgi:hypothetical protein
MDVTELDNGFKVGFHTEWSKHDEYVENCFIRVETPTGIEEIRPEGWVGWRNAQAFHVDANAKTTHLYNCTCSETENGVEGEFESMQNGDLELEVEGDELLPGVDLAQEISEDRDGIVVYVAMEVSDFGFLDSNFEYFSATVFQNGENKASTETGYM